MALCIGEITNPLPMIGINRMSGRSLIRGISSKGIKHPHQVQSGLELSKLPEQQFQRWSEQVMDQPLPLKSFLSQHRPLMNVLPPKTIPNYAKDMREVMFVHHYQPKGSIFAEGNARPIPYQVAQDLGPFSISQQFEKQPLDRPELIPESSGMPRDVRKSVDVLAQFLGKYNRDRPATMHLPLHEGRPYVEIDMEEIDATSVRRKRKLKMNRHKYRKRLKEQRTLKRRLGK